MNVRLSFTTKVVAILLAMILTVTIVISAMLIHQSELNIEQQHLDSQLQNQRILERYQEFLNSRTVMWVDAFANTHVAETDQRLADALQDARDYLDINLQVVDVWLFSASGKREYGNTEVPGFVASMVRSTQEHLQSQSQIQCVKQCLRYITIPVMSNNADVPVIVLSTSLQELLSMLAQSTSVLKLTLVKRHHDVVKGEPQLSVISKLTEENQHYIERAIARLPALHSLDTLIKKGQRLSQGDRDILLSILPLPHSRSDDVFVLYIKDITDNVAQMRTYQNLVVGSAVSLFVVFTALLILFLNGYRAKLMNLSQRLPLLAKHRYAEFRQMGRRVSSNHPLHFDDELDVLQQSADDLASELEEIENKMAVNTAQLENMAMFDGLTGLPNRNMLTFQIEKQIANSARDPKLVALMFLDLDDFKKVNDSYGHDVGDKLLKAAANRIARPIRDTDIAARFGGDEFVVLLSNIDQREQVEVVAQKLLDEFTTPIGVGSMQFYVTVSIGIAITQHAQISAVELLRHADIAMYEAKAQQGAAYRIYDTKMNLKVMRKVELESEARVALREDEFSLALQPQLELRTRKLVGFEALLRWNHPEKGPISPAEFIPLLEHTPFMLEMDYWVVARATRLLRELNANGYRGVKMAINLSSGHFLDPSLPAFMQQQIQHNGIEPSQIALELTETVLVSDLSRATTIMNKIRDLGCLIAIDDFGTGYSSLSYLKALPVDFIKIDKSFITGMIDSQDDRSIVYSTITMVRNMGLTLIAEGLELPAQYELLCHFNCQQGQGYLISRPIPEAEIWPTLNASVKDGLWANPLPVFEQDPE